MKQNPETVHVTQFGKQIVGGWNVSRVLCSQMVVAGAKELCSLVSDECAETFRKSTNIRVLSTTVVNAGVTCPRLWVRSEKFCGCTIKRGSV